MGRVGGSTLGKDLDIKLEKGKAFGRLGGRKVGDDISLHGTAKITGRVGGRTIGFNCNINVSPDHSKLTGPVGRDIHRS